MPAPQAPPTLVVLAGGLGKRFGGRKPLAGLGPGGETAMDINARLAVAAGVRRAVVVVRSDIVADVGARIRAAWPREMDVEIVSQDQDALAKHRRDPLGPTHAAVVGAREAPGPWLITNADDVYGPEAWADAAAAGPDTLVAFHVGRTLLGPEAVNRALCRVDMDDALIRIDEGRVENGTWSGAGRRVRLSGSELVSTNMWFLGTEAMGTLERAVDEFVAAGTGGELALPTAIGTAIEARRFRVRVVRTSAHLVGVTYAHDVPRARLALADLAWA